MKSSYETLSPSWDAIITHLIVDEGLRESCESLTQTSCNADQATFKGITVYYMYASFFNIFFAHKPTAVDSARTWFLKLTGEESRSKYENIVKLQADKVLEKRIWARAVVQQSVVWERPGRGPIHRFEPSCSFGCICGGRAAEMFLIEALLIGRAARFSESLEFIQSQLDRMGLVCQCFGTF